jgi:hypothetical protein
LSHSKSLVHQLCNLNVLVTASSGFRREFKPRTTRPSPLFFPQPPHPLPNWTVLPFKTSSSPLPPRLSVLSMFYDLFIPFPSSSSTAFQQPSSSQQQPKAPSKRSRKGAAAGGPASATGGGGEEEAKRVERERRMKEGCWFGVSGEDKERMESAVRMGRHRQSVFSHACVLTGPLSFPGRSRRRMPFSSPSLRPSLYTERALCVHATNQSQLPFCPVGYTVLSFAQTAHTRIEASSHYNPFYSSIPFTSAPTPSHLAPPSDPSPSSLNPAYPAQLPFPALDPRHASSKGESTAGRPVVQLSRLHLVLDDGSCGSGGTGYVSILHISISSSAPSPSAD